MTEAIRPVEKLLDPPENVWPDMILPLLALATAIALAGLVLSFLADCGVEASLALHPDKATIRARIREDETRRARP